MAKIVRKPNFEPIFDIFEMYSPQNDESIESENNFAFNILSDELFINNYKMNKTNESNSSFSIESELSSLSKKDDPLENIEQINEIKYNFFMILNNDCSYNEEYNEIFSISNKKINEIKLRRLVIQKMNIVTENEENKVLYDKKDYIFFPCNSNNTINFDYEIGISKQFIIEINKNNAIIMCDREKLKQEEIFENYPSIKKELENEKRKRLEKFKENRGYPKKKNKKEKKIEEDDKEYNIKKQIISDNNKSEDNLNNIIIEQNTNEKDYSFSLIDYDSEDEAKQKSTFYINQNKNIFYRFSFCNCYKKEIDGIYTTNKEINLKIEGEINLSDSMKKLISGNYNVDNDLKSYIIYKNFQSNVIEKNTPMFLEIKKSFVLFDLLTQIKQNVKIINHMQLEKKDIKLPQLIIGIMCNYEIKGAEVLFKKLNNQKYKDKSISILEHNLNIINEEINGTKIKVLIGAIKDGIINKYPLNIQDYHIEDPETKSEKRVDLKTLNKMALEKPYKDNKIEEIYNKYKDKYKSLTSLQTLTLTTSQISSLSNEENKQLKEKIKKMEEEKRKMEEKNKKMEEEKIKMEEKNKKMEEQNKKMEVLLSKFYSNEQLKQLLEESK